MGGVAPHLPPPQQAGTAHNNFLILRRHKSNEQ
jgi:hypothetical protein